MRNNLAKAVVAAALSVGLTFGLASPAFAASSSPSLSSPGFNSPGLTLGKAMGQRMKLGHLGGPAWSADIYSQIVGRSEVRPGDEITIRIEASGVNGDTRIREIGHIIPADFKLVRVTRQSKDNLFGNGIYTLKQDEYTDQINDRGNREVRLQWTEGGFLGLFKDNPAVNTAKSIAVDFTYKAPSYEAEFDHGGLARIGAVIDPKGEWPTGGEKIKVTKSAKPSWWLF
nr:hypothetical protein [Corynebacterium lactis]